MPRAAAGLLMLSALLLSGCGDRFPDYHYKMTVHVLTPEGDKTFSSVRGLEQKEISSMQSSSGRTVKRKLTGQAVIIDGNGRTYYALLTKPDNADYATLITGAALAPFIPADIPESDIVGRSRAMSQVKGAHPLPRTLPARLGRPPFEAWPMFVTFDDPKDPKTVREVSPDSIGVSGITIEITDEDVTTGIDKRLEWLRTQRGSLVRTPRGGSMYDKPAAHRLTEAAFSTDAGL
jgi:hypothetical protein